MQSASHIPLVRIYAVVCQSGAGESNKWIAESRNVVADYERAVVAGSTRASRVSRCKSTRSIPAPPPKATRRSRAFAARPQ